MCKLTGIRIFFCCIFVSTISCSPTTNDFSANVKFFIANNSPTGINAIKSVLDQKNDTVFIPANEVKEISEITSFGYATPKDGKQLIVLWDSLFATILDTVPLKDSLWINPSKTNWTYVYKGQLSVE